MRCPSCQHLNPDDAPRCARCAAVFGSDPVHGGGSVSPPRLGGDSWRSGRWLRDRFELQALIGSGAMGDVWSARDRTLGRAVALKILSEALWESRRARERMAREASALARIQHPNVVAIHDVFEEAGALVLALELVTGGTLADRLRAGPVPLEPAVALLGGILEGLEAVHREGVVHRDVKPSNVLLTPEGTPKLADLGVARDSTVQALTATGVQLGTLDYMSPEQIRGGAIGPPTDLYAVGILAFELLTGTLPFAARTDFEVMAAHLGQAPNLLSLQARAPLPIVEVISVALAKAPTERWQSARDLRAALLSAVRGERPSRGALPVASAAPQGRAPEIVGAPSGAASAAPHKSRGAPEGRRRRSRHRRPPEPIGPGTLVVQSLTRPESVRGGWCLPLALLLAVVGLFVGLLIAAAVVLGALRLGGGPALP